MWAHFHLSPTVWGFAAEQQFHICFNIKSLKLWLLMMIGFFLNNAFILYIIWVCCVMLRRLCVHTWMHVLAPMHRSRVIPQGLCWPLETHRERQRGGPQTLGSSWLNYTAWWDPLRVTSLAESQNTLIRLCFCVLRRAEVCPESPLKFRKFWTHVLIVGQNILY